MQSTKLRKQLPTSQYGNESQHSVRKGNTPKLKPTQCKQLKRQTQLRAKPQAKSKTNYNAAQQATKLLSTSEKIEKSTRQKPTSKRRNGNEPPTAKIPA